MNGIRNEGISELLFAYKVVDSVGLPAAHDILGASLGKNVQTKVCHCHRASSDVTVKGARYGTVTVLGLYPEHRETIGPCTGRNGTHGPSRNDSIAQNDAKRRSRSQMYILGMQIS